MSNTVDNYISMEHRRMACEERRVDAYAKSLEFSDWFRVGEEDGRALLAKREVSADQQLAYDTGYLKGSTSRKEWCQAWRWQVEARIAAGWVSKVTSPDISTASAELARRIVDLDWRP